MSPFELNSARYSADSCFGQGPDKHDRRPELRVLLSGYACEPDKGSEPADGWMWARQIARFHDVWVITRRTIEKPLRPLWKRSLCRMCTGCTSICHYGPAFGKRSNAVCMCTICWANRSVLRRQTIAPAYLPRSYSSRDFWSVLDAELLGAAPGSVCLGTRWWRRICSNIILGGISPLVEKDLRSCVALPGVLRSFNPIMFAIARRSKAAIATTGETALRLKRLGATRVEVTRSSG